jgi:hypothetical protein
MRSSPPSPPRPRAVPQGPMRFAPSCTSPSGRLRPPARSGLLGGGGHGGGPRRTPGWGHLLPHDPTSQENYRSITLLDTDYRALARVLARRLLPAFDATIAAEQTAFLRSRRIADNVWLLQLLPALLRVEHRAVRAVFLDFYKAYDTVDRGFLLDCLAALGVGRGFLRWVQRLHTGTGASALVSGHCSRRVPITSGVLQGCPLVPLLYLAVGQALVAWLRAQGIGIGLHFGGRR